MGVPWWPRLGAQASLPFGPGPFPSWGTEILEAARHSQKKKGGGQGATGEALILET